MLIGADIGNGFSKFTTCGGSNKIMSRIKQGFTPLNDKVYNVEYANNEMTVGGEKGEMDMENDKYMRDFHDILLFTGISSMAPKEKTKVKVNIVTGMPVEYYLNKDNRKEYKNKLKNMGTKEIEVDENKKEISIDVVSIFPQSAVVWNDTNKYRNCRTLVGDIGAGTFDISVWDGLNLVDGKSFEKGIYKSFFRDLATELNSKYGTNYNPQDLDITYQKDFVYDKSRNKVDITKAKTDYLNSYFRDLVNTMNSFYKISDVDELIITGGGSCLVKDLYLKNSNIAIEADQSINSKVYYKVGEAAKLENTKAIAEV